MKNKELSLRQQLDALSAEGKEIKVTWEGGNDSGGYSLFIDDVEVNYGDAMYDEIVDPISDRIDYGSWAGDFSADGEVIYDPEQGAFVGSGKDTEAENCDIDDISIEIRIPKVLNFDSIQIETEGTYCWGELDVSSRFIITNGPVFPDHGEIENAIRDHVINSLDHILSTHDETRNEYIGWVSNEWMLRREMLREDGDDLVGVITNIEFSRNNTKESYYTITINED